MANKPRPIYYDTETTGIRNDKDRIIELAAYDPIENRTFCHLINPGMPIPKEECFSFPTLYAKNTYTSLNRSP